jgi:hypothetical protein
MGSTRTMRTLALIACALGAITLCCWLGVVFLNPYPVGAQCGTQEGYAAIEAHAETNSQLLLVAVLCAGTVFGVRSRRWVARYGSRRRA